MTVSVIMYKRMGISNSDIALYTSWLYLPWVIKPLWSPVVDLLKTKRQWIIAMQLIIGAGLGCVALTLPLPAFFKLSLGFLWLLAFSSATHDIAIDGFYMLGLDQHQQTWFVGIRTTFYRIAMLTGQGLLIIFAGYLESSTGLEEIRLEVQAVEPNNQTNWLHPDSIRFEDLSDHISIMVYPETLQIAAVGQYKESVDSVLGFVKNWNVNHNFIEHRESGPSSKSEIKCDEHDSDNWLESWLRNSFGQQETDPIVTKTTGNIGLVYFRLSQKPENDQEIHFNFGMSSGDQSIALKKEF
jgi:PAT family beta-lactamase induction signal transducer AmpG